DEVGVGFDRFVGVEGQPGTGAQLADHPHGTYRCARGLGVDGDAARSRLRVTGCPTVGILDHQVTVQGRVRGLGPGLHDRHTAGEVGDEVPVHDVDVQPVGVGGH